VSLAVDGATLLVGGTPIQGAISSALDANIGTATTNITTLDANLGTVVGTTITGINANIGTTVGTTIPALDANLGTVVGTTITGINANLGTVVGTTVPTLDANLGTATTNITTINANLGTVVGTTVPGINANIGGFQTYANSQISSLNANIGITVGTTIPALDANVGTIVGTTIPTLDANVGTIVGTTIPTLDANLGTATTNITTIDANLGTATTNITTIDANLGTATTNITTIDANVGAFQTYSNAQGYISNVVEDTTPQLGGNLDMNSKSITGSLKFDDGAQEKFATLTGSTGVVAFDCANGHLFYNTGASGDITANFTNLVLAAEYATNLTVIINQDATPREVTAVQIGGVGQTIEWQGGVAPTGNANGIDSFSFTILNDGGTYVVLGQMVDFT